MRNDELSNQSLNFAVSFIIFVTELKAKHGSVMLTASCRTAKDKQ